MTVPDLPPQMDGSGVSFSTSSDQFNIFRVDPVNYGAFGFNGLFDNGTGRFSATPVNTVPEPATDIILLALAPSLFIMARRRNRTV